MIRVVKLLRWTGVEQDLGKIEFLCMRDFQTAVGGWVIHMILSTGENALVNEEAILKGLPMNPLCFQHPSYLGGKKHPLGNVVVFTEKEWSELNEN